MREKAVIFDLYGTLVLPFPSGAGRTDIPAMAEELGVDESALRDAWAAVKMRDRGLRGDVEADIREVLEGMGATVGPDRLRRAGKARQAFVRECLILRSDAVSTLERLSSAGLQLGLLSNCSVEVPEVVRATPLAPFFDVAVFSSDEHVMKPDPRIYQVALDGLGLAARDCAFVGDGYGNELTGATAVGMRAIHIAVPGEEVQHTHGYEGHLWTGERVTELSAIPGLLGLA